MENKKIVSRRDLLLVALILLLAGIGFLVFRGKSAESGDQVVVKVDGQDWNSYPLSEDRQVEIETDYGKNVLCIEDGQAWMKEADCPDKYCVDKGKIDQENEIIVCLPHKLTAEIISGQGENADEDSQSESEADEKIDVVAQ